MVLGELDDQPIGRELVARPGSRGSRPLLNSEASSVDGARLTVRNWSSGQPARAGHDRVHAGEVELRDLASGLGRGEELHRIGERRRRHRPDEALDADHVAVGNAPRSAGRPGGAGRARSPRPRPTPWRRRDRPPPSTARTARSPCVRCAWPHTAPHRPARRAAPGRGRARAAPTARREGERTRPPRARRSAPGPGSAGAARRRGRLEIGVREEDRELVAADAEGAIRHGAARRSAGAPNPRRTRSPLAWPRVSLIDLKSSRSTRRSESGTL